MEIIISNSSGVPLYEQIREQIKTKIVSGELKFGEPLPSIRALARDLRCSIITTKNAYDDLVGEGYLTNVPAKGFYVASINRELVREEQLHKIETLLDQAIAIAKINEIPLETLYELINILSEEETHV